MALSRLGKPSLAVKGGKMEKPGTCFPPRVVFFSLPPLSVSANWQQRKDFKTYPEQQKKRNFLAQRSSNRFSSDKKNRRWQNNTGKEKANEKKEESFESRRH
ncbi:hypothetical protein DEO72_LG5g2292 [Vigna unguiculata]|uniref:Uncharacterized protein n=1 Tax=Vigna unguiculata TaxID=3917 RepID=A0A4D6M0Z6_VIGUN|nr:hypothetical protein DEO72_LG5g2292 [Vigna unguiculata]